MRSREEQIIYLGSRLFVGNRNLTDANCEAQRHIDEAIQRGRELERAEMGRDTVQLEWMSIDTAPQDGTAFQARIPGHGDDNVIRWDCSIDHVDGNGCGTWAFASEQEPPDCWTDGWCWASNEDGEQSVLPTHWKSLPDAAMNAENGQ